MQDKRICLSDTHDGDTRYLYCKHCHNILKVIYPGMSFTIIEGDLSNFALLDTKMVVNARCRCANTNYVEIHEDTLVAHNTCSSLGIDMYYDYGEIIAVDPDRVTRNWKGDIPIFTPPSLEINGIRSESAKKRLFDLCVEYKNKLIIRQNPGYCGLEIYIKFDGIIHTPIAKDNEELCSLEYFNKLDRDINDARTYMEEIIEELIKISKTSEDSENI